VKSGILFFTKYIDRIEGDFEVLGKLYHEFMLILKEVEQPFIAKDDFTNLLLADLRCRFEATVGILSAELTCHFRPRGFSCFINR